MNKTVLQIISKHYGHSVGLNDLLQKEGTGQRFTSKRKDFQTSFTSHDSELTNVYHLKRHAKKKYAIFLTGLKKQNPQV